MFQVLYSQLDAPYFQGDAASGTVSKNRKIVRKSNGITDFLPFFLISATRSPFRCSCIFLDRVVRL
jgi:hypothetical protein